MTDVHSKILKVTSYEADKYLKIKLTTVFQWFSESAWEHAKELNVGFEALDDENNFWVLLGLKLVVNRLPKWQEHIVLETWPNGIDGLYFNREFVVWDENKTEQMMISNSKWFIYNRITNRPVIPKNEQFEHIKLQKTQRSIEWSKIKPIEHKISQTIQRTSYFTDIDMHQHTNNAIYIKWIEDYVNKPIKEINVQYMKEVRENEQVIIHFSKLDEIIHCDAFVNELPCFRANIYLFE